MWARYANEHKVIKFDYFIQFYSFCMFSKLFDIFLIIVLAFLTNHDAADL